MRFHLHVDATIEGSSYADALSRIAAHFTAWSADTPSDDPDSWVAGASLAAPQFEAGSTVGLTPAPAPPAN